MQDKKEDILSFSLSEIEAAVKEMGEPSYRAKQIFAFLHRGAESFEKMHTLPLKLRERLDELYYINLLELEDSLTSKDGTVKFLFRLIDGRFVESVLMKYKHGYSICVSTQVGCRMGCAFCATGQSGFERDLTPSEMLGQVYAAAREQSISISHVVLMGMGEPLDNFQNVVRFLELLNHPEGINMGMRNISLSTSGLCDIIDELARKKMGITLSVSLHAPNDEIRDKLMPINRKYPIGRLLKSCDEYMKKTGRRISFEYTLMSGINDEKQHALELSKLLKGKPVHVNLISVNEVKSLSFKKSEREKIKNFQQILMANGINATIRRSLGQDIEAACGQLKRRHNLKK